VRTDVSEFRRWHLEASRVCDPWLIPIQRGGKAPDVERGASWKDEENRLTPKQAEWRLENGFNVGVSAGDGLAVMDVDDPEKAQEYIGDGLMRTLVCESRSGKPHLYFENGGVDNADITEDGEEVVELRAIDRYVLAPGSWCPSDQSDGLYKVVEGRRPMLLRPDMLPNELKATEKVVDPSKTSAKEMHFDGEWLSLPCVKRIYTSENLPMEGRRRVGGKILSMAWHLDGKDESGFLKFIRPYAERNRHGHGHRPGHYDWLRTIKSRNMEWNCAEIRRWLEKIGPLPCGRCPMEREKFEVSR